MFLQVYFAFTYLPHICIIYIPFFALLCRDVFGIRHILLCSGYLFQFAGQYISDLVVLLWQGKLYARRVGTTFGRETPRTTLERLQRVGGHMAPLLSKRKE